MFTAIVATAPWWVPVVTTVVEAVGTAVLIYDVVGK